NGPPDQRGEGDDERGDPDVEAERLRSWKIEERGNGRLADHEELGESPPLLQHSRQRACACRRVVDENRGGAHAGSATGGRDATCSKACDICAAITSGANRTRAVSRARAPMAPRKSSSPASVSIASASARASP